MATFRSFSSPPTGYSRLEAALYDGQKLALRPQYRKFLTEAMGIHPGSSVVSVLDLGCGTGTIAARAKHILGSPIRIFALDISQTMLTEARYKFNHLHEHYPDLVVYGNIPTKIQSDTLDITQPDLLTKFKADTIPAGFDRVTSFYVLHLFERWEQLALLESWKTLLAKGGQLVVEYSAEGIIGSVEVTDATKLVEETILPEVRLSDPNVPGLAQAITQWLKRNPHRDIPEGEKYVTRRMGADEHTWKQVQADIEALAADAGLKVTKVVRINDGDDCVEEIRSIAVEGWKAERRTGPCPRSRVEVARQEFLKGIQEEGVAKKQQACYTWVSLGVVMERV